MSKGACANSAIPSLNLSAQVKNIPSGFGQILVGGTRGHMPSMNSTHATSGSEGTIDHHPPATHKVQGESPVTVELMK